MGRAEQGFWGKLGNLLCLLPPLPRDVMVSCAQGGLSAATHSSIADFRFRVHHFPQGWVDLEVVAEFGPEFEDSVALFRRFGCVDCGGDMYWALGSRRSSFGWFVLCSVGASRRCYLGMSDSHLLLSWAGSGCCDMMPDIGQTQLLRRESRAAVLPPPLVLLDNHHLSNSTEKHPKNTEQAIKG